MNTIGISIVGIFMTLAFVAVKIVIIYAAANFFRNKLTNNWSGITGFLAHFFCWTIAVLLINSVILRPLSQLAFQFGDMGNGAFFRTLYYSNPVILYPILMWKFKRGHQNKWVSREIPMGGQISNFLIFNAMVVVIGFVSFLDNSRTFVSILLYGLIFGLAYFTNRNNQWADFVEDKPLGNDSLESGLF